MFAEPRTTASAAALLERKRRYLVPCTYHFFERPPQIVRGEGAYLFDTEGKRYLDCVAGVSVLSVGHSHPDVVAAVRRQLGELAHHHPAIGDVRGLGLMIGVELVDRDGNPDPTLADAVLERLKGDGVLVGKGGADRNVLALHPPLIVTVEQMDEVVEKLGRVL